MAQHSEHSNAGENHSAKSPNRLTEASSPYLLQHAYNPVDWWPWCNEAFVAARKADRSVFLSVGYSTCHWCHVMAHESFEDEDVASILNEHFIPIKVDREERPDVDAQYMLATQLMTQHGGWPNSVWLMPDGRPWFAGTYFPREDHMGRPGFKTVLLRLAEVWRTRRDEVEQQADQLSSAIRQAQAIDVGEDETSIDHVLIERGLDAIAAQFDPTNGGFGGAPKFPPHGVLALLLSRCRQQVDNRLIQMIDATLMGMAHGGIHDHLGGGFHRYATDAHWLVPHFEKMLYDNAQLLQTYAEAHAVTGEPAYRQVARQIVQWIEREMTDAGGGFYSAIDADSEGEEGRFYVWSADEIRQILSQEDAELFMKVYGVRDEGNWREEVTGEPTGTNILHLPHRLHEVASEQSLDKDELHQRLTDMRARLLAARDERPRPDLDNKILASWNGLMIAALAESGRLLNEPRFIELAEGAARFVLANMRTTDDRRALMRSYRDGTARQEGFLDDHVMMIEGLIELHQATHDDQWLNEATELADLVIREFEDPADGGFFYTSSGQDPLLGRTKNPTAGGNTPMANAVAVRILVRLAALADQPRYLASAERCLRLFAPVMHSYPLAMESMIHAAAVYLDHLETGESEKQGPAASEASTETTPDASVNSPPLHVETYLSHDRARPGETVHIAVRLDIESGWHVYGPDAGHRTLRPTQVYLDKTEAAHAGEASPSPTVMRNDPLGHGEMAIYEGEAKFMLPVTIASHVTGRITLPVRIEAQPCDDQRCLEPRELGVSLQVEIDPDAPLAPARHPRIFR